MKVVVALEHRFDRTPDGAVWTCIGNDHEFWRRYLTVFDSVRVAARVREVAAPPPNGKRADGPCVSFAAVPCFVGPWQYLRRAGDVRRAVRGALGAHDAVILRIPGTVGTILEACLRGAGRPFGVEVVGDPYDVFAPRGVRSVLRPLLRWWFPRVTRRQCAAACAALYVTQEALQARYPPSPAALAVGCSDVVMPAEAFVTKPRCFIKPASRLVYVGTLEQLYKAPDVLIDAVERCVREGLNLTLEIVGDGRHRAELERRAAALKLCERVTFCGMLPGAEAVRGKLDECDLFVLPSRTEGLPRAAIEAMARALPCIGSTAGGFPELFTPQDMVPPGDANALASKIREMLCDPQRLAAASLRNLEKAREYRAEILDERRRKLYQHVRGATERWLASRPSQPA